MLNIKFKDNIDMFVILGQAGVGKSAFGEKLSNNGFIVLELDKLIKESENLTPKEIINIKGVKRFREIEARILRDITSKDSSESAILIAGGGVVDYAPNLEILKQMSIILLKRNIFSILLTLNNDFRGFSAPVFLLNYLRRRREYLNIFQDCKKSKIILNLNKPEKAYNDLIEFVKPG